MTKRNGFLLLAFAFLLNTIHSQSQVITVVSEASGEAVENVALYNSLKTIATLSEKDGKANISIFSENDSIFFQHPSYSSVVFLKKDMAGLSKIRLKRKIVLIDEFVISANKYKENKRDVPFKVDIIGESSLIRYQEQNSADILLSTGNITVQKSQGGGGSPVLRGFEANKILLVVDGVRLNNAIYRSGHLQNSITIDHAMLERVEVVYGPTSLLYGSDALGGIIHYSTRDPRLSSEKGKNNFNLRASSQYSTANNGKAVHFSINNGFKKVAFLTGISHKKLGDLSIGKNTNPYYGDFGKLLHYVKTTEGSDTTVTNPDPYIMKNTGYSQTDLIQKIRYSLNQNFDLILNLQYSTSSEIDRFDELNDYRGANMNYAEYYYGPQNRLLASVKSVVEKNTRLFSGFTSTMAYQRIDEDRISRRFRNDEKLIQEEDVDVYSLNIDFNKSLDSKNGFFYGLEATINQVESNSWYENIKTGVTEITQTRYPDGGSNTWSLASYGKYRWKPAEKIILATGFRYQYGELNSIFSQTYLPYDRIVIKNGALTGSLSMVYHPGSNWQLNTIASTGFRNPNVDDYGKVRAKDGLVTVPNPLLKSEYTWNIEAGLSKTFEGYIKVSGVVWYTHLTNAITRSNTKINNSDSLLYDGQWYQIITNSNAGKAYIKGFSVNISADINKNFILKSTVNVTDGWNLSDDEPMGHISPVFGRTSISYLSKRIMTDLYMDYNGWKRIENMSTLGEDNAEEGTEFGFPAWNTFNMRTSYTISPQIKLQIAVENIFDRLYKPFASALPGPGRNFIISLRADI